MVSLEEDRELFCGEIDLNDLFYKTVQKRANLNRKLKTTTTWHDKINLDNKITSENICSQNKNI